MKSVYLYFALPTKAENYFQVYLRSSLIKEAGFELKVWRTDNFTFRIKALNVLPKNE